MYERDSMCVTAYVISECDKMDSSVKAGFPKKIRAQGERGVRNTWIPQCRIPHIWNHGFKLRFHMWYANPTKNGKHVNVRA